MARLPTVKKYGADDEIRFGKYRGKTVQHVLEEEPDYLVWAVGNVRGFYLEEDILVTAHKERSI